MLSKYGWFSQGPNDTVKPVCMKYFYGPENVRAIIKTESRNYELRTSSAEIIFIQDFFLNYAFWKLSKKKHYGEGKRLLITHTRMHVRARAYTHTYIQNKNL